jgi:hypothetical protein
VQGMLNAAAASTGAGGGSAGQTGRLSEQDILIPAIRPRAFGYTAASFAPFTQSAWAEVGESPLVAALTEAQAAAPGYCQHGRQKSKWRDCRRSNCGHGRRKGQ